MHELLAKLLQLDVDAQLQVLAGNGRHILGAVLVAPLDFAHGVANENLAALAATQIGLVTLLDAQVASVVARAVVVVVVDVALIHLANVAQHIGATSGVVLPQDALHDEEARIAIEFLLQAPIVLGAEVVHEHLLRVGRIVAHALHLLDAAVVVGALDLQRAAKVGGVKRGYVLGNHHQVVGRLVIDDEAVVAVKNQTARRINRAFQKSIAVGIGFVLAVHDLQLKEFGHIDEHQHHDEAAYHILSLLKIIVFSHGA